MKVTPLKAAIFTFTTGYALFLLFFLARRGNKLTENVSPYEQTDTERGEQPSLAGKVTSQQIPRKSPFFKLAQDMLSTNKLKEGTYGWYLDQLMRKQSIGIHSFDPSIKSKLVQYGFGEELTTRHNWFGFFRNYDQAHCRQPGCQVYPLEDSRNYYHSAISNGIRLDANIEHLEYRERGLGLEKVQEERKVQEEIRTFISKHQELEGLELSKLFDQEFALKTWLAMRPLNIFLCNEPNALYEIEPQFNKEHSHMDMSMCWSAKCSIWTTYFYTKMDFEFKDSSQVPPHCICAFISNCVKDRMYVVNEISQVVPVRQYGKCGRNANEQGGKVAELARSCKFYMAFENSLLDDYITEKFFEGFSPQGLGGKLVSIYRGATNINDYGFPKDSFINFHDFKSATELAQHIKPYCDDDKKFDDYFKQRMSEETKKGIQDMSLKFHLANVIKSPCKLCTAIGEMKLSRYLLFKLGLKPKYYRVGKSEFEEFIKSMEYNKLNSHQLEVLWDIYDRAYGRLLRKHNNKTNWNDYDINWVAYVKDQ